MTFSDLFSLSNQRENAGTSHFRPRLSRTRLPFGPLVSVLLLLTPGTGWSVQAPNPSTGSPEPIDYEATRLERVVTAVRSAQPIVLDGRLDEPAWDLAIPATNFTQRVPDTDSPSVEPTEVRFVYDDNNLYVGFLAFDSEPDRIVVNDLTEDYNFRSSDGVGLILDSLRDMRSGYLFNINPAGARADYQVTDGQFNADWDAVWDVRTSRTREGWVAEVRIPFKTLRFSDSPDQVWGVNMSRRILRRSEESLWSPVPFRYSISRVALAGTLEGLEGIDPGTNLKIKPFVTAGISETQPRSDLLAPTTTDGNLDGGLDLKFGLTSALTLDATYRTDFAQVEADQQQVNLTRFNLFFPEKREFFLENAGTFTFGGGNGSNLVPFFSRRIGLDTDGQPIPIFGGARVTGQVGRYDVGFLSMQTEEQGNTPSNNYSVGRIKRNLLTNSWVGALATNRDSSEAGDFNRVYGVDAHFQFYDRLELDSFLMKSRTPGLHGEDLARQFEVAWRDDELIAAAGYNQVQDNFNPEVGFIRRRNVSQYHGELSWNPLIESSASIRNLTFGTSLDYDGNATTGDIETRTTNLNVGLTFQDNGSLSFQISDSFERLQELFRIRREVRSEYGDIERPGVSIPAGDYGFRRYSASATTDPSRKVSGNATVSWGEFWNGRRQSIGGALSWKPDYHFNIDMNFDHNRIDLPTGLFTTDLVGTRIVYSFTSRAFLNAFVQYNAETRSLASNIRFHFIHHPLSDFYLVYNDVRDTNSGQLLDRAFIVKLTNLFDF